MDEIKNNFDEILCSKCNEWKSTTEFYKNKNYSHGYEYRCRSCEVKRRQEWAKNNPEEYRKAYTRSNHRRHYRVLGRGLNDWVDEQLEKQKGICAMPDCNRQTSKEGKALCIDHNHTTKKLRALLCRECNLALAWYEGNKHRHSVFEAYLAEYDL